jgi:hypothetical protein
MSSTFARKFRNISLRHWRFSPVSQQHTPRMVLTCSTCQICVGNEKKKGSFRTIHTLQAPSQTAGSHDGSSQGNPLQCKPPFELVLPPSKVQLQYITTFRKTPIWRQENKPLSINSCAAWRSSSNFSGVSSGPCGSRTVATIPLSRYQHQSVPTISQL